MMWDQLVLKYSVTDQYYDVY